MNKKIFVALLISVSLAIPSIPLRAANQTFVFSAPPLGFAEKQTKIYAPIAAYLSKAIGKHIVFKYPGNWLNYQADMQQGKYDLVFDGPHFVGWRMAKLSHVPLVKLPGNLTFVVVAKNSGMKLQSLAGLSVCGLAPPNLATLTLYNQFPNPMRQPRVWEVKSFPIAYKLVQDGKCAAAVMRDKMFFKLRNTAKTKEQVIWTSDSISNLGFSAGPRFSDTDKAKITQALMSPDAQKPLANFFNRFSKKNRKLLKATAGDYAGLGSLLKDVWGFAQ